MNKRTFRFSSVIDSLIAGIAWAIWDYKVGAMVALLLILANVASLHSMYYNND